MATSYTTLLGLALPVQGELQGTWGDEVNNYITNYLDAAVAGTQNISTDVDVTLTKTTGTALTGTSSQYSILLFSGSRAAQRTVTVPAASKSYVVINATTGGFAVKVVGVGPTTGVTIAAGEKAVIAWNGSDFVRIAAYGGTGEFTTVDTTNLEVTNVKAKDGTSAATIADSTGVVSFTANPVLSGGTANGVLYLDGSKVATSGSALTFDGSQVYIKPSSGFQPLKLAGSGGSIDTFFYTDTAYWGWSDATGLGGNAFAGHKTNNYLFWQIAGSEQMRLTSTGLGIGTSSPARKLHASTASAAGVALFESTAGTISAIGLKNTGSSALYPQLLSVNDDMGFQTSGGERMRLDASGNLGLGVTPSAWNADYKAIQVGVNGSIAGRVGTSNTFDLTSNGYRDNVGGDWRYIATNPVSRFSLDGSIGGFQWYTAPSGTAGNTISFTQAMTLDASGNLGVGITNPAYKLVVSNGGASGIEFGPAFSGTANLIQSYNRSGAAYVNTVYDAAEHRFNIGGTERARIDSSGNLGLGVTPSAWATGARAFQFDSYSALFESVVGRTTLAFNARESASGSYTYLQPEYATMYQQVSGIHSWYTAPSGTAGNAISFSQVMTLDASGNLGVGVTSISGFRLDVLSTSTDGAIRARSSNSNEVLRVESTGTATSSIRFINTSVNNTYISADGTALTFLTAANERARITSGGKWLVNSNSNAFPGIELVRSTVAADEAISVWNDTTTGDGNFIKFYTDAGVGRGSIDYNRAGGLTRYNTTSDYRAKDIIGPITNSGEVIDSLKVYEGVMKGATQSRPMLIAHEAQAHAPYAVSGVKDEVNEDGTPKYQQMDVSSLVPLLLAEIQNLRARVAALETN